MHSLNFTTLTFKRQRVFVGSLFALPLLFIGFSVCSQPLWAAEDADPSVDAVQFVAPEATPKATPKAEPSDESVEVVPVGVGDATPIDEVAPAKPAEIVDGEAPVGDEKDKPAEKPAEDKAKVAEENKDKPAAVAVEGAGKLPAAEIVKEEVEAQTPPPPVPTPEELEMREKRSDDFRTLGEKTFGFPVTGSLVSRYRVRGGEGSRDQDLYEFLSLDIGDKSKAVSAHFDSRFSADIDGRRTGLRADVFSNVLDTYSSPMDARLYTAYLDFNKIPGLEFLRAGRQWTYETPEILNFDGVRVDTNPFFGNHEVKFSFYGGVPVDQYKYSNHGNSTFGQDVIGGSAIEGRPMESMRLRLDFVHIENNLSDSTAVITDPVLQTLNPAQSTISNNLYTLSLWQTFVSPNVRVQGSVTALDDQMRDAMARILYNKTDWRLQVAASYKAWFKQDVQQVLEFDHFTDTLSGQNPYQTGSLVVSKGWTDNFWMESGGIFRRLMDQNNTGLFNNEFNRYYTTLQVRDLPVKGLTASVTGSRWDGLGHAPTTSELGADLTYKYKKQFQSSIGSDYALYKYDLFQNKEHDNVRTYYVKQRWHPTQWATLDVNFEHERSRTDKFNTLTATFRFDF